MIISLMAEARMRRQKSEQEVCVKGLGVGGSLWVTPGYIILETDGGILDRRSVEGSIPSSFLLLFITSGESPLSLMTSFSSGGSSVVSSEAP